VQPKGAGDGNDANQVNRLDKKKEAKKFAGEFPFKDQHREV